MARYAVGRISEFTPGSRKIVSIAGRSIGIFFVNGEFFAVQNRCPHAGAPLCEGSLGGVAKSSEPGQYEYIRPNEFIRCPWHSWEFDLKTGRSWFDPSRIRAKTFETSLASSCPQPAVPESAGGPPEPGSTFLAETYPVTVDDSYVQVEI
jgi:nitrite reductase/ring-hydroxylating ferredoxin subunit